METDQIDSNFALPKQCFKTKASGLRRRMPGESMNSRLPNLIIGGVHKAGTTSLFVYLSKHPEVCASHIKEIGFFMPLRDGGNLPPISEYHTYFTHCQGERYVMEASPSYIYGREKIADAILEHCGKAKMIMILREPVDRLGSFYNHIRSKAMLEEQVDISTFIRKSTEGIHDMSRQNYFTRGVREGFYSDYLDIWFEKFGADLKIVFFDDLKSNPMQLTKDISAWLGLTTDIYKPGDFTVENKTVYYKNKALHKVILSINKKMEAFWRKNHSLKKKLRGFYYTFNADKSTGEKMDADTIRLMQELYAPYNRKLKEQLLKQGYTQLPAWLETA